MEQEGRVGGGAEGNTKVQNEVASDNCYLIQLGPSEVPPD